MPETIISVHGEFQVHHPPERGTVRLAVEFESENREQVVSRTSEAHGQITAELGDLYNPERGPVTWWSSDDVHIGTYRPWNQDGDRLPLLYRSAVDVAATFTDFAALADWVSLVAPRDGTTVHGVEWTLTDARQTSVVLEARKRAVEDAVSKAAVYAASLGLATVRPIALSDPGMLGDGGSTPPSGAAPMMFARSINANDSSLALKPGDILIRAEVDARFAAS